MLIYFFGPDTCLPLQEGFTRKAVPLPLIAPLQLCRGFSPPLLRPLLMNTYALAVHLMSVREITCRCTDGDFFERGNSITSWLRENT